MFVSGKRFGPYEIIDRLGEGGMGEVYKARDTRLDRTVALKVLPAHVASDLEVRMRFEREARAISALSHPNICTLYDVGREDGREYLVMEYLDGETLAERLMRGPLDLDDAIRCGVEIADALERAHRQGIVHRDLKPGNIVLTREGAKLLDFGLAKSMLPDRSSLLAQNDDKTVPLTSQGTLLGTIPYMAPEQLEGREVDARSDIFAFGAILYEMATGVRAFNASSNASLIAAIMREEPPSASRVRDFTPRPLDQIIRTCLAKDPDDRFQSAHDIKVALQMVASGTELGVAETIEEVRRRPWLVPLVVSIVAVAAMVAAVTAVMLRPPPETRVFRFNIAPPSGSTFPSLGIGGGIALSPDGRQLVFEATTTEGRGYLWLRSLDSEVPEMLEGTEGGEYPFWSPDGRAIAFFADGKLKRMNIPDGPAQSICDAPSGRGGSWTSTGSTVGTIIFAPSSIGSLHRVSAAGGVSEPLSIAMPNSYTHRWPVFVDEKRFLFVSKSQRPSASGVFAGSLDTSEVHRVLPVPLSVALAPPNRLYYVRDDVLVRQRLNLRDLELTGDAATLSDQMVYYADRAYVPVTAAADGIVVFRRNGAANMHVSWYTRDGLRRETVCDAGEYQGVSLSPDGVRVAFGYFDVKESLNHIAIAPVRGGAPRRFTFARGNQYSPIWSPDGTRLVFSNDIAGVDTLAAKPLAGTTKEQPLLAAPPSSTYAHSWSPDGEHILFRVQDPIHGYDIHVLSLESGRSTRYVGGAGDQSQGQFSPDGRSVAYTSTESGRLEVYVQPFPATGAKWQISIAGGEQPRWRRDGKELYYLAADRSMMVVPISVPGAFGSETPRRLFQTNIPFGDVDTSMTYDVTPDGERFLIAVAEPDSPLSPLTVMTR